MLSASSGKKSIILASSGGAQPFSRPIPKSADMMLLLADWRVSTWSMPPLLK